MERFDSRESANAAYKSAWRAVVRTWQFWVFLILFLIAVPISLLSVLRTFGLWSVASPGISGAIYGALAGGCIGASFQLAFRNPVRRMLRERLAADGVPICVPCGYDLRGQTSPRCPECGTDFDPSLLDNASPQRQTTGETGG